MSVAAAVRTEVVRTEDAAETEKVEAGAAEIVEIEEEGEMRTGEETGEMKEEGAEQADATSSRRYAFLFFVIVNRWIRPDMVVVNSLNSHIIF